MNKINLQNLELKTFTEQDVIDYCSINNINPDNIIELYLDNNNLTDISGIKLFKNLRTLDLECNKLTDISIIKYFKNLIILRLTDNEIKDISAIQYLNSLISLDIGYLELESDQFKYIKELKNLKELGCKKGFKDMSVINQLNKNISLWT